MVEEFPSHLEGVEKALKPVQQYLDQANPSHEMQAIDDNEKAMVELMPQCLKTLYYKFKLLQQWGKEGVKVTLETTDEETLNIQNLKTKLVYFYRRHEKSTLCQNVLMSKEQAPSKDEAMEVDLEITK